MDDYADDVLSEEEETVMLGGEGFSPEQLAEAEKRFQKQPVRLLLQPLQTAVICIHVIGSALYTARCRACPSGTSGE